MRHRQNAQESLRDSGENRKGVDQYDNRVTIALKTLTNMIYIFMNAKQFRNGIIAPSHLRCQTSDWMFNILDKYLRTLWARIHNNYVTPFPSIFQFVWLVLVVICQTNMLCSCPVAMKVCNCVHHLRFVCR